MDISEYDRHQLFVWLEEHMGPERAATMINALPPSGWSEVATKGDLARLEASLTKSVVTWLLTSQAVGIAIIGLIVTLR